MKKPLERSRPLLLVLITVALLGGIPKLTAQNAPEPYPPLSGITTPKDALGFNIGDDYHVANYSQLETYWKQLASESDRLKLVDMGPTAEGRHQYMMIISSPANMKNLDHYKEISRRLALAQGLSDQDAHRLAGEGKSIVWIDGGLHASETVGSQQLMELVYQMASRTDPETRRFLNDDILLAVQANPDGQELVANWYMRNPDPAKRSLENLPRLFQKYVGHDNNRDFYMSNMPETTNINRQLFLEWFPQIVYNHHQTGPAGGVIFMPPFRDPFNYNMSPLIPLDIESVGVAMHERLVADGRGGSEMRSGANYSTWWNGGLRTITYFHNMIGLLTEIIGNPTPMKIPLVPDKQLASGDWPLPIAPQEWHYRESIDYEISNNRAVLDYASRNRETLLYDIYRMGQDSIQAGSEDSWTITPKRIAALEAAAAAASKSKPQHEQTASAESELPPGLTPGGMMARNVPPDLYKTVLHDPKYRDPRGYIIPSDQPDFPTAIRFINALEKTGIEVLKATSPFQVAGRSYPAGSYIVKTAQAFRPHVLDMFEPQDYPNDFLYPGGPPKPPYDTTGYTLALQMGVQFERILEGFDGPFVPAPGIQSPPPGSIQGPSHPAGYLMSHRINNSYILVNRLLKANCDVYWLKKGVTISGADLGTGSIWVSATPAARGILQQGTKELGLNVYGVAKAPAGEAMKLRPIRIGLYDQYGGLMPSGWTRWLFEQYEFPYEIVYPQTLDAGNLKDRFDVLVFTDGAVHFGAPESPSPFRQQQPKPETIPEQYRSWLGHITTQKTIPQIQAFVKAGGEVLTIGSSTSMGSLLGVPVNSYLTAMGRDENDHPLTPEQFYIPGSILETHVDNTDPLAYGLGDKVDVFFDRSPVFKLPPDADQEHAHAVAWYAGSDVLVSGWAWGEKYLDGGTAIVDASVGDGKVILLGPEIAFRGQPDATFKFLFNGVALGSATSTTLR
ncbi:MAG TPA: M14 metallopeptidase family protein [Acidobacteriaceae bacterium]|nr:M14 metallopeptidase family protein [Acidobacteriaceae bacterium]